MTLSTEKRAGASKPTVNRTLVGITAAALSGLLLTAAHPDIDCAPLAWVALVPWLLALVSTAESTVRGRIGSAIASGIAFTAAYAAGLTYWVVVCALPILGPARTAVGFALLTFSEAVFFCLWAAGALWLYRRPNRPTAIFGIPALWVILVEWLRQLGPMGLTWGGMGYTQHAVLPLLQMTKLTGAWGLAYLIVLVNVVTVDAAARRRFTGSLVAVAAVVLGCFLCGAAQIGRERLHPTLMAAVVQGDINPNVPQDRPYVDNVLRRYIGLTNDAADLGATLTVWPELAFPGYIPYNAGMRNILTSLAARRKIYMVVGAPDYNWSRRKSLNSLFLIDDRGDVAGSYHKRRLVPFGEYVPASDTIPAFRTLHVTPADMLTGASVQPLMPAGPFGKIGSAICFESSFPDLVREPTARGATLLVVSTDDLWFDHTSELRQHAAMSQVRAVENDRYVVRASISGISQIIDPTGRVVTEGPIDHPAVVIGSVEPRTTRTLYVRFGDWFVGACGIILLLIATFEIRRALPPKR